MPSTMKWFPGPAVLEICCHLELAIWYFWVNSWIRRISIKTKRMQLKDKLQTSRYKYTAISKDKKCSFHKLPRSYLYFANWVLLHPYPLRLLPSSHDLRQAVPALNQVYNLLTSVPLSISLLISRPTLLLKIFKLFLQKLKKAKKPQPGTATAPASIRFPTVTNHQLYSRHLSF